MPTSGLTLIGLLAVATGGAIGSVLRYTATLLIARTLPPGFPYATLFVNVAGSFAMGVVITFLLLRSGTNEAWRLFFAVGVLGGFTTFSTFSLEMVSLIEQGNAGAAMLYIFASVGMAGLALIGGIVLVRSFS